MRKLLSKLGVDAGMMSFSPTELGVGVHLLSGICGDGYVIHQEGDQVDVHVRVAELADWGPRIHDVHIGGKHLPAGYQLAGRVDNPTGRIMVVDPCYLYQDNPEEDHLPGPEVLVVRYWGRDADKLTEALEEAGVPTIEGREVAQEHLGDFFTVYKERCQDPDRRRALVQLAASNGKIAPEEKGLLVMWTQSSSASVYDSICNVEPYPRAGEYACRLGKGVVVSTGYGDGCYPLVQHDGFLKMTFIGPDGEHPYDLPEEERGTEAFTG